MRTFVVIIFIALILLSLVLGEKLFIREFCAETTSKILKIKSIINNDEQADDLINEVVLRWHKQKKIIFAIANHNSFKEIENGLFNLKYYVESGDKNKSIYYINNLHHKINELKGISKLDLSNIL